MVAGPTSPTPVLRPTQSASVHGRWLPDCTSQLPSRHIHPLAFLNPAGVGTANITCCPRSRHAPNYSNYTTSGTPYSQTPDARQPHTLHRRPASLCRRTPCRAPPPEPAAAAFEHAAHIHRRQHVTWRHGSMSLDPSAPPHATDAPASTSSTCHPSPAASVLLPRSPLAMPCFSLVCQAPPDSAYPL